MNEMNHIYGMSNAEIVMALGKRFKDYRIGIRLTQKEMTEKCGMSLLTLRKFENGQALNITMANFIAMLREVSELDSLKDVLPEIPVSPYDLEKIEKTNQRECVMENNIISVRLWDKEVGRLYWSDARKCAVFSYNS